MPGWGNQWAPGRHEVVGNQMENVSQGLLNDLGGIYFVGRNTGTVVRHNVICDVTSEFNQSHDSFSLNMADAALTWKQAEHMPTETSGDGIQTPLQHL